MSQPLTSTNSKPEGGDEQTLLQPNSASDSQTQYVEKVCAISTLDEDAIERLHRDSKQPQKIHAVPIHRRPDLLVPCADLVNSEWQRSQAARVHSLQKSCPEFPICLVLLQGHGETERLLGHSRLSRVVGQGSSLFVESVVVSKVERGKGYGRILMEQTEHYAKSRGFKRLCLTTHDKQHFYAHLGYELSTPVQNAGAMAAFVPMEMLLKLSRMPTEEANLQKETWKMDARLPRGNRDNGGACVAGSPPPPPPPPPPLSIPPPPPPPSFPPPPAQSAGQLVQTLIDTPYRDAKGVPIYWMHKDI